MDRRHKIIAAAGAGGLLAAALLWFIQQRAAARRRTPDWTDPEQPPDGTAGQPLTMPTAGASWSAARPGDPGMRGGSRVLRDYAPTLTDDPGSVVR